MAKRSIAMKLKPTAKQHELYQILFDAITMLVLFGGSGGCGKSFVGCEWLLFMSLRFPGTRWFMARAELKELRSTTVLTLYKVLKHHRIKPDDIFTYNQVDGYFKFHNGSRIDLLALKYEPSDPLYSRFGSLEFTGGLVDEASGIRGEAIIFMQSRIGRSMNAEYNIFPKILICSNPVKSFLYHTFYVPWKEGTLPPNMKFVQALPRDNPHLDKHAITAMKNLKGALYQRNYLGLWEFETENAGIIEYQAIIDAFSGPVSAKVKGTGEWFMCVDPARYGADSSAVTIWNGLRLENILLFQKLSITELVEKINDLRQRYGIQLSNIVCDSVGLGSGVIDLLPGAKQFIANARPIEMSDKKQMYTNLKTQASFRLAELMNEREIFINCPDDNYELKERIVKELEVIRVKDQLTDGTLNIIPKKEVKEEIGHSPDVADSIVSRMLIELEPRLSPPLLIQNFNLGELQKQIEQNRNSNRMPEYGFTIGSVERTDGKRDFYTF